MHFVYTWRIKAFIGKVIGWPTYNWQYDICINIACIAQHTWLALIASIVLQYEGFIGGYRHTLAVPVPVYVSNVEMQSVTVKHHVYMCIMDTNYGEAYLSTFGLYVLRIILSRLIFKILKLTSYAFWRSYNYISFHEI